MRISDWSSDVCSSDLLVAIALLPSQLWMARLGGNMQAVAEQDGLAAAVGVVGPDLPLGETVFENLAAALPPAREAGVSVFAWPQPRWSGRNPGADALHLLGARGVDVAVVETRPCCRAGGKVRLFTPSAPPTGLV